MTRVLSIVGLTVLMTACFVCGCDDDDDQIAGVSKNKEINDLTEGDLEHLCGHYAADLIHLEEQACIVEGLAAAAIGGVDACESAVANCQEAVQKQYGSVEDYCYDDGDPSDGDGETADDDLNHCDMTVGEVDHCFNDFMKMGEAYFGDLTCEDGALDLWPEELGIPDSCVEVAEKCPEVAWFL